MSELFRKVMCSDRLPENRGLYDTNLGRLSFEINPPEWLDGNAIKRPKPEDWQESVKEPTDEEIKNIAKTKFPNIKTAYRELMVGYATGYKQAIEDLKGEKK